MKKACLVVDPPYLDNRIFLKDNNPLNRDNCLAFFHQLQDMLAVQGIVLATQDIHDETVSDFVFYNDIPKQLRKIDGKSVLFLWESDVIKPWNWDIDRHKPFDLIFTWNDEFVDNKRYFKFNFTHGSNFPFKTFVNKSKFACIISGNKSVTHPLELYSERERVIRWFEANKSSDFDLFGVGWGLKTFNGILRPFNRIPIMRRVFSEKWPSYRGPVQDKLRTLSDYKFSICFENAKNIPGYITEKLFDVMAAGTIPIYWGAPNIEYYVPKECFIDFTQFRSMDQLYDYLIKMDDVTYSKIQDEISIFLSSRQHDQFLPGPVAGSVVNVLTWYMDSNK